MLVKNELLAFLRREPIDHPFGGSFELAIIPGDDMDSRPIKLGFKSTANQSAMGIVVGNSIH